MKTIQPETATRLAEEIQRLHERAETIQQEAVAEIQELIEARVAVSTLAETAKANLGASFHQWWRESGLPAEWDHKYIRIAKTSKRLGLTDKNQMRLIGILPDPEGDGEEEDGTRGTKREANPFAWIKLTGKLRSSLTYDRIAEMDKQERETARLHLKPLVELYNALAQ